MHLAPRDLDKLVLHGAGFLAQKRLARGLRLNYPETVALLATQLLELIRDGKSVAELMDLGGASSDAARCSQASRRWSTRCRSRAPSRTGRSSSRFTTRSRC